jgi:hypothetical protein
MFMIGLDCSSNPEAILVSFNKWLATITHYARSLLTGNNQKEKDTSSSAHLHLKDLLRQLEIPLTIVMCKADSLQVNDLNTMKTFKNLQGSLRSICHECKYFFRSFYQIFILHT